jgi:hypothetical protein
VDYNDERFNQVNVEKDEALKTSDATYDYMINQSDKYYDAQMDAVTEYGDKQSQIQQQQTDFAIEQIEQQKDQAYKDYTKEQSASYVDYMKQSNQYGSNAEQQAQMGLAHTGYSESSQVSMWNTYQNRYAMARESYNRAVLDYDNAIKAARLQNSSILADIAFNTLQTRLQLSLQGFQYKNQLLLEKANKQAEIDDRYHARWQDVLQQINTEMSFAEQVRQYNESIALRREENAEQVRQFEESIALQQKEFAEQVRQHNESIALQQKEFAEQIREYNESLAFQKDQFEFNKKKNNNVSNTTSKSNNKSPNKTPVVKNPLKISDDEDTENENSSGKTLDTKSVINLGYGPISGDTVAGLVATGEVTATEKNGTITVKKNDKKPSKNLGWWWLK